MGFVNYKNGNYVVYFNTDTGDKIRNTHDEEFKPAFAENCDVTITTRCDGGCEFCYMGCTTRGKHGNLMAKCLDTLHPYTELAINGNDLSHPDLIPFLKRMRDRKVIVNMTVNQKHFEKHYGFIQELQFFKLIHGVGVSLNKATDEFIEKIKSSKNTILHVINGILSAEDAEKLMGNDLDILILGYKTTCRGHDFLMREDNGVYEKQQWLWQNMQRMFDGFRTVEFDNLALDQLSIKNMVDEEVWNKHFMGDDGSVTYYIDLVNGYFAKNSTSPIHYPLMDSVDEMFKFLQEVKDVEEGNAYV
jgi:hypothetical protein